MFSNGKTENQSGRICETSGAIQQRDQDERREGHGVPFRQTKQIARNILAELDAVGMGREQIAMTTTYVLGDHLQDFMKTGACSVLFEELDNPADTLVGVAALAGMPYGALIEVGVIAVTA